jgi:hypothetical protein
MQDQEIYVDASVHMSLQLKARFSRDALNSVVKIHRKWDHDSIEIFIHFLRFWH